MWISSTLESVDACKMLRMGEILLGTCNRFGVLVFNAAQIMLRDCRCNKKFYAQVMIPLITLHRIQHD